ncbi:MAG: DUF4864 domain-containing protein [Rhodospirillales bacterium]|nr:DUF4864 domain-containing protein [Rhodospirillales bacterium]
MKSIPDTGKQVIRFHAFSSVFWTVAALCVWVAVFALVLAMPPNVRAEGRGLPHQQNTEIPTEDPEEDALRLIHQQLAAIRARNAEQAFALMTARSHEAFESANDFLGTLRFEYRPLYNSESLHVLHSHKGDGDSLQTVEIFDEDGDALTVLYRIERQSDGRLLIDSFTILDDEALAI